MSVSPGKCVFCGKDVTHTNDGGNAWLAGGFLNDQVEYFLYCNEDCCDPVDKDHLWSCCNCSVDNVTLTCHACRRPRTEVDADVSDPDDDDDSSFDSLDDDEEIDASVAATPAPVEPCWNCCDSPVPGVFVHEPETVRLGLHGVAERCNICCVFPDNLTAFNAHRRHLGQTEFSAYPFALFNRNVQTPSMQHFYMDCAYVVELGNDDPTDGGLTTLVDLEGALLANLEDVMDAHSKSQKEIGRVATSRRILNDCDTPQSLF